MEITHKWRIPIIYLSSAIGGCLMHVIIDSDVMVHGASGGVFGLMGVQIAARVLVCKSEKLNKHYFAYCINNEVGLHQVCKRTACGRSGKYIVLLICVLYLFSDFVMNGVKYFSGVKQTSIGAHLGGLIVGTLLGIITLKEDKSKQNRIIDYYFKAQDHEEYKKAPTRFKRFRITLCKKKLKATAFCLLAACVIIAICVNVSKVDFSGVNSTQCFQRDVERTNCLDGINVNASQQSNESIIIVENDDWVTQIVTPGPTERTISTPGPGAPTSNAGKLEAVITLRCLFINWLALIENGI
jgi:hypothetical protein